MGNDIAVIGMSVMGSNLALNMADHGFCVTVYNRTSNVTEKFVKNQNHKNIYPVYNLEDLVSSLSIPRKVMLMIKAGSAVDSLIENLIPLLSNGDIIIDGGNSYFKDTTRRYEYLKEKNIHYFGVGVSGGEEGARKGPAIMPGGDKDAYEHIRPILEGISAKVASFPCCSYTSFGGAGHYVKMVHNGIEYGDMQLISETYSILKHIGDFTNEELSKTFSEYNKGELESYLIQISAKIFSVKQEGKYLLDYILDKASQKGTGKWTNMEALELGNDISVITSALNGRFISNLKEERIKAANLFGNNNINKYENKEELAKLVYESLYLAKIISYAQGFKLLKSAEKEYGWTFDYAQIARIFRGGCIIQAKLLQNIIDAFSKNSNLQNLLFDEYFSSVVKKYESSLRKLCMLAIESHVPASAHMNALSYLDSYSTANSSANLIQAQRDYFGAHTFERTDKEGSFHFDWVAYEK